METILGIKGPDFVMVAADSTHARSIMVMKTGKLRENRFRNLTLT